MEFNNIITEADELIIDKVYRNVIGDVTDLMNDFNELIINNKYDCFSDEFNTLLTDDFIKTNIHDSYSLLSNESKQNYETTINAMKINGLNLKDAPAQYQNNKKIVLVAIQNNVLAFKYASNILKKDIDILLTAINKNPSIWKFIPNDLKSNKKFILHVFQINMYVFDYIDDNLKNDQDILKQLLIWKQKNLNKIKQDVNTFKLLPEYLKKDRHVVLTTLKLDPSNFLYLPKILKDNKDTIKLFVETNGLVLEYLSDKFKNDKEIVLTAVKQNINAVKFISKELINDKDFISKIKMINTVIIPFTEYSCLFDDDFFKGFIPTEYEDFCNENYSKFIPNKKKKI